MFQKKKKKKIKLATSLSSDISNTDFEKNLTIYIK